MRAIYRALEQIQLKPRSFILVSTDNTSVVAYINHQGGTRSSSLWQETKKLFDLLQPLRVLLRAVHIPGHLNSIADMLSREGQILPTEWSLNQSVVETDRLVRDKIQPQMSFVRVSSPRSSGLHPWTGTICGCMHTPLVPSWEM